jgi:hypothetical protein
MGPDQWAELIKEIIGSREAVQAVIQGAEHSMRRVNPDLTSHLWGSLRRWKEGIPFPFWESLGGITYNLTTKEMFHMMDDVPDELYQRAVEMAGTLAVPGIMPSFDQKVLDQRWTYRMVAVYGGSLHLLTFYRRPKRWPWIVV